MDKEIFKDGSDYWLVAKNIRNIYLSDASVANLLDFERVLDSVDLYAFKNWDLGELVQGPDISRYHVSCVFMWPANLMPDPRGAVRLLPFDADIKWKKTTIEIPIKIKNPSDYRPGTHKARLIREPVWLVEITLPRELMEEIRTGSIEIEGEEIDLGDIDDAYNQGLDQEGAMPDQQTAAGAPAQQPENANVPGL